MTRRLFIAGSILIIAGCATIRRAPGTTDAPPCCTRDAFRAALADAGRYRNPGISTRRFTHREFWTAVDGSIRSPGAGVETIGQSVLGRDIRAVTFGNGPTRVLLWSQMHGDESTATMALADIFRFLSEADASPLRQRLLRDLTIVFVPMLNPDGAELFQRQNAAGIDVNRDARRLATPEARALKALRDAVQPQFGFNLHDQNARTRAGADGVASGIALLPPAYDEGKSYNEVRRRARLVAATLATAFAYEIPGRVAKYDDDYNARAFGDLMQQWGTSTVLIESGALPGDPQKQRLRALNFAGILLALDAIATRGYETADAGAYERLPFNEGGAFDLLVRGGHLVLPGKPPMQADLAINYDDAVARTGGRLREVGDLADVVAIDTIEAGGLYLYPAPDAMSITPAGPMLRLGAFAEIDVRRGPYPASDLVRRITEPAAQR
ncbi:MAG: M14 family zinc carboxypeptidase [Gemmatimonadaceae bacterium]